MTDTWTQIQAPWAGFTAGSAAGTPVQPDGRNITQLQIDVGLTGCCPPTVAHLCARSRRVRAGGRQLGVLLSREHSSAGSRDLELLTLRLSVCDEMPRGLAARGAA